MPWLNGNRLYFSQILQNLIGNSIKFNGQASPRIHIGVKGGSDESPLFYVIDRRTGTYASAPRPNLILLDLNLPKKDGREVLEEIKSDPHLRSIPVVILTTSRSEHDVQTSYDLQASSFITKPRERKDFISIIAGLETFWSKIATPPSE